MNGAAARLAGISVLVVDDDDDARELTEMLLRYAGATVQSASSATEALDLFKTVAPTVVVTDIAMPHHDGIWLLQQIRGAHDGSAVPVIAFTALAMAHDRRKLLAAGFTDHIIKPVDPDEIVQAIVRATTSG